MVEEIKKNLTSGTNVIIDRYAFSGVAFSAAKVNTIAWSILQYRKLVGASLQVLDQVKLVAQVLETRKIVNVLVLF